MSREILSGLSPASHAKLAEWVAREERIEEAARKLGAVPSRHSFSLWRLPESGLLVDAEDLLERASKR